MNDRRTETTVIETGRNRISWAAVLAGVAITFTVMMVLNLLAMGIGLGSINITEDATPLATIGAGFGIIMVLVNLIALAAGGYVAGRYAGHSWTGSGFMQGVLTWAVSLVLSLWLMGTAGGALLGSVGNVIGGSLNLAGQGIGAVAPGIAENVDTATADLDDTTAGMEEQLGDLLRATADEDETDVTNPVLMDVRINEVVRSVFAADEDPFTGESREDLVSLMVENTDLSEEEADEIVTSWEQDWENAQQQLQEAETQLRETAEEAQATVTWLMLLGALALVVFALVTGFMGRLGANHRSTHIHTTVR